MAASSSAFAFKIQQFIAGGFPVSTTKESIQEGSKSATGNVANEGQKTHIKVESDSQQEEIIKEPELISDVIPQKTIFMLPKGIISSRGPASVAELDWELLSERGSFGSSGGEAIFVARAGSVRSIASMEQEHSSSTTLSVPYKIQRTNSSSTIDSQDNVLGPSGKGVLGVDYVEHIVLPTDTLQGICIAYKVGGSSLRRANHFTGHSLHSAPKKLLIPLSKQALRTGFIRIQDTDTKEYKLHYFQLEHPDLCMTEAKAHLELADWDLKRALRSAKEDKEWEEEVSGNDELRSGQISIKLDVNKGGKTIGFKMRGVGQSPSKKSTAKEATKLPPSSPDKPPPSSTPKKKIVIHNKLPAIATKSVFAEDVYKAALEDQSFGVELKPITRRAEDTQ